MEEKHEVIKQLLEIGLNYAKKNKSGQTGYLHYCYHVMDQETYHPIPLVENFLYALLLLRSRVIENIQEAKTLLEGLLHFQNTADGEMGKGNFPIYLHEFPRCKDRFTGVQVAITLYWILKLFHHVIGQELNARLEHAFLLLLQHLMKVQNEKSAPYPVALKIAAVAKVGGELLHHHEIAQEGGALLQKLEKQKDQTHWFCPAAMGNMLTALSLVYQCLEETPWQDFWNHLSHTWHRQTGAYVGPAFKEYQYKAEPQLTLYDLFLGHYSGVLSRRAMQPSWSHLEAALIPPSEETLPEMTYPYCLEDRLGEYHWKMHHGSTFAYSLIMSPKKTEKDVPVEKCLYPLKIVWGNLDKIHVFVGYGGVNSHITNTAVSNQITLDVSLDGLIELEDRERCKEISFAIDTSSALEFLVDTHKSSTFRFGENLTLLCDGFKLEISFILREGEGRFMGHRMLGNRPTQLALKGNARFDAYDWEVFMRTINRTGPAQLQVILQINTIH